MQPVEEQAIPYQGSALQVLINDKPQPTITTFCIDSGILTMRENITINGLRSDLVMGGAVRRLCLIISDHRTKREILHIIPQVEQYRQPFMSFEIGATAGDLTITHRLAVSSVMFKNGESAESFAAQGADLDKGDDNDQSFPDTI